MIITVSSSGRVPINIMGKSNPVKEHKCKEDFEHGKGKQENAFVGEVQEQGKQPQIKDITFVCFCLRIRGCLIFHLVRSIC